MKSPLNIIQERWDTHAKGYDARHYNQNNQLWMEALSHELGEQKEHRILDVGAGSGFLSLNAARAGYHNCYLADMSTGMLEVAEQHANEEGFAFHIGCSTAEDLPYEDNFFDRVMNRWLLWTLLTPEISLQEWYRVLKPGGKLICFCTIGECNEHPQDDHYSTDVEQLLPLKYGTKEQLIAALEQAGFTQCTATEYSHIPNHDPEYITWYSVTGWK